MFSIAKRTAILCERDGELDAVNAPVVLSTTPSSIMRGAKSTYPFGSEAGAPVPGIGKVVCVGVPGFVGDEGVVGVVGVVGVEGVTGVVGVVGVVGVLTAGLEPSAGFVRVRVAFPVTVGWLAPFGVKSIKTETSMNRFLSEMPSMLLNC